jgi:hypothetical protein
MPDSPKSLPTLVEELWSLVVAYAKQETVGPLKGLLRFVAFGLAGSLLLGLGVVLLVLGGLRALQTETDAHFTGKLSFLPYLFALVGTVVIMMLALSRVKRGAGAKAR